MLRAAQNIQAGLGRGIDEEALPIFQVIRAITGTQQFAEETLATLAPTGFRRDGEPSDIKSIFVEI